MTRIIASVLLVTGALAVVVSPAAATFPGRNGALVLIVVDEYRGDYSADLMRVGASGGPERRRSICGYSWVTHVPLHPECAYVKGLTPSPDGRGVTLVAGTFTRELDDAGTSSAWVADLQFGGPERWRWPLVPTSEPAAHSHPRWSPDGSRLLLARTRQVPSQTPDDDGTEAPDGIELFSAGGQSQGKVLGGDAREPDWSAKGEIAYVRGGRWPLYPGVLYRTRLGGVPARVAKAAASPSWSSDGAKLAFVRRCPPIRHLLTDDPCTYVVRAKGGKPRLVARKAENPVSGLPTAGASPTCTPSPVRTSVGGPSTRST